MVGRDNMTMPEFASSLSDKLGCSSALPLRDVSFIPFFSYENGANYVLNEDTALLVARVGLEGEFRGDIYSGTIDPSSVEIAPITSQKTWSVEDKIFVYAAERFPSKGPNAAKPVKFETQLSRGWVYILGGYSPFNGTEKKPNTPPNNSSPTK